LKPRSDSALEPRSCSMLFSVAVAMGFSWKSNQFSVVSKTKCKTAYSDQITDNGNRACSTISV
jgi:hypothetical protein